MTDHPPIPSSLIEKLKKLDASYQADPSKSLITLGAKGTLDEAMGIIEQHQADMEARLEAEMFSSTQSGSYEREAFRKAIRIVRGDE